MSGNFAQDDREDREHLDDVARTGHGRAGAPFDPWGSLHGQLTHVFEARDLARAEQQPDTLAVTGPTEMNEVRLAFRALIEQVRLVLRDSRRLVRTLIALRETSKRSRRVQMPTGPAPVASVPLVVLRSTTEREQIELNDVVQSLSAEGYQVARRGPQWVVYTEITDRRHPVIGSPQGKGRTAAVSEPVRSGSLRHRRSDDIGIASAASALCG